MNGKLASLISARSQAADNMVTPAPFRALVKIVYPKIAEAAYRGMQTCLVYHQITDEAAAALRADGFVVRFEPDRAGHARTVYTSIEWCLQNVLSDEQELIQVSPIEYNAKWEAHDRARNLHLTAFNLLS